MHSLSTTPTPSTIEYHSLADRLWDRLKPLGYTRYEGKGLPAGIQFYAPGIDDGFIECNGRDVIGRTVDIQIQISPDPAWAEGLKALAAVLDGEVQS